MARNPNPEPVMLRAAFALAVLGTALFRAVPAL
jgi:hypothetical protein